MGNVFKGNGRLLKGKPDKDGTGHREQRLNLTRPQVEHSV